ncbi:hypothetical protein BGX20_006262 [Mortierella sp. AD010]|nr:hypothetical protein BGX20_006262 [Mortierella sp. AD010]
MTRGGWKMQTCDIDADVAIAQDCKLGDIVVSGDSDMSVYSSVSTLWRLISRKPIVSNNDCGKNIFSLGPATCFSIIKGIGKSDVQQTVNAYLEDSKVALKNTDNKTSEYESRLGAIPETGELRASLPDDLMTLQVNVEYNGMGFTTDSIDNLIGDLYRRLFNILGTCWVMAPHAVPNHMLGQYSQTRDPMANCYLLD